MKDVDQNSVSEQEAAAKENLSFFERIEEVDLYIVHNPRMNYWGAGMADDDLTW